MVGGVRRRWAVRQERDSTAVGDAIASAYPDLARSRGWLAPLLVNRGLADPEAALAFLGASLSQHLRSPLLMKDMQRATMRVADAVRAGERIVVYSDYDVDGISGSALVLNFLRELGVNAGLYVPNRLREGYGLNEGAVRQIATEGANVLITVDCGTANARELAVAATLGLDVIVCDHHHAPVERPPAFALLNPLRRDCTFPFKGLSGAGVAFYLLMGLRMELRERGIQSLPNLRRYLDLVTLGTVGDVVPLRDENRVFVKYGLRELDRGQRPGIAALKEVATVDAVSVGAVGFRLAPLLNAGGRVADARKAIDLLTTDSLDDARIAAASLNEDNIERRELQARMVAEAVAMVEADATWHKRASIVVGSPDWHPGVVGIVAARLVERYYRPAFVVALGQPLARGSGRSIRGLHLVEALEHCGGTLRGFGGHRAAAGISLRPDDLGIFAAAFEQSVRSRTRAEDFVPQVEIDREVRLADLSYERVEDLRALEPTGPSNPAPTFVSCGVEVAARREVGTPTGDAPQRRPHLKLVLRNDGATVEAIGFGLSHLAARPGDRVDIVYSPRTSVWEGRRRVELHLVDLRS